jgi:cytochrome c551/c552/cytochrome c5
MFRCEAAAWVIAGMCVAGAAAAAPWQGLGRTATAEEIAGWNIDVRPDGAGLPPGHGSVADGQTIYDERCATCHGTFGESAEYIQLAGGVGSLATTSPQRTVGSKLNYATTLWDYINRAMPFNNSKSLTVDEVYAVTAYVLNLNDIIPADAVLDEKTLPQVQMPNRDGFTLDHGMGRVDGKPDVHNTACMKDCVKEVKVSSELPENFAQQMYGDMKQHFRGLATMNHQPPPAATAAVPGGATAGPQALAQNNGCLACHGVDKAIVGPAFVDVGKRYRDNKDAGTMLTNKVRQGGSGVWGSAMMPPQANVPEAELATILTWILEGAGTTAPAN